MATDEKKQQVLPVYLVIDVSYSMAGDAIKSAQQAVDDILFEIKTIPTLAESAFIAVITFCERADRIMPMSNLSYVDASPVLELGASTSYVAAIDAVLAGLRDDVAEMKANGKAVFRPCVFFLTDGEPTAHITPGGDVYFNYPPVRETIEATLREVVRCTREQIRINTFVLDATTALTQFIEQMTQLNGGRAFYTTNEALGDYVLVDFLEHRRRMTRRRAG